MRLKKIRVSRELIAEFAVKPPIPNTTSNAPKDLVVVGASFNRQFGTVDLIMSSESFPELEAGQEPPDFDLLFTTHTFTLYRLAAKIDDLNNGRINLDAFEDWFISESWGKYQTTDDDLSRAIAAVHHVLHSYN